MIRGKEINDKLKAEIIETKLNNPSLSDRAIQKSFPEVKSNKTISTIVRNEFTQNTQRYDEILVNNVDIVTKCQKLLSEKLDTFDIKTVSDLGVISNIAYHATKQNQIIENYGSGNDFDKLIPSSINITVIKTN